MHWSVMLRWCRSKLIVQSSIILPFTSVIILGSNLVNLPLKSPKHIRVVSSSTSINFSISFCNFLFLLKSTPDFSFVLSKYERMVLIFVFLTVPSRAKTSLLLTLISSSLILLSFLKPIERPPPLSIYFSCVWRNFWSL